MTSIVGRMSLATLVVALTIRCGGGDDGGASDKGSGGTTNDAGKKDAPVGIGDGSWAGADGSGGTGGSGGSGVGDAWAAGGGGTTSPCILATHSYGSLGAEYATRFGKIWSFAAGVLSPGYPRDLTNVTRYTSAVGPCAGKPSGGCGFDTLAYTPGGSEIITAYGQKWSFTGEALDAESPKDLTTIERYSEPGGPCEGKTAGSCHLDTLAFDPVSGELVTVSGKIWSWTAGTPDPGYPKDLTSVSRYADAPGPCANKIGSNCRFDTMTFDSAGAEVVTVNGKMWRFTAGTLDAGYPLEIASITYMSAAKNGPCL